MSTFHKVAEVKDIPPGGGKAVQVGDHQIALFNVEGTFYAIGAECTHQGGPLAEGSLEGTTVTCPWHGASFEISTGKNLSPPAPSEVPSYKVRVEGNDVEVEIT